MTTTPTPATHARRPGRTRAQLLTAVPARAGALPSGLLGASSPATAVVVGGGSRPAAASASRSSLRRRLRLVVLR